MESVVTLEQWLRWGSQRSAILQALRKPMPASELCIAARRINSHLQLRDLWLVLPQLKERGLIACLTPRQANGKLYALTLTGRRVVQHAFAADYPTVPHLVNWRELLLGRAREDAPDDTRCAGSFGREIWPAADSLRSQTVPARRVSRRPQSRAAFPEGTCRSRAGPHSRRHRGTATTTLPTHARRRTHRRPASALNRIEKLKCLRQFRTDEPP